MKEYQKIPDEVKIGHLVITIARLLASRADRSMEEIGLYRGQAILLMILSEQEGLTHTEIAQKLEISPAAATKVIKRMESLNYLERRADTTDDRISRVFLREDAWGVINRIRSVFQENERLIRGDLTPDEQDSLIHLLMRVREHLQKPTDETE